MKNLLEKYLKDKYKLDYIHVDYFNIDDAFCNVQYYYEEYHDYKEHENINIWDMLIFLNEKV